MKKQIGYYFLTGLILFSWAGAAPAQQDGDSRPTAAADPNNPQTPPPPPPAEPDLFTDAQTDMELSQSLIPAFFDGCDTLFGDYVSDNQLVRYCELRRKRSDLFRVYEILDKVHPALMMSMDRDAKIAFWINAYNVCMLKLIVDNYPIEPKFYMIFYPDNSIMQITNAWTKQYFDIQGLEYTLDEIKNELLLERLKDPRICFAISYASMGGGRLRPQAYRPETLNDQLNRQVREYLASDYGCKLEKETKTIHLSNLFSVHREVFLASEYAEIKKFRSYPDLEKAWLNFLIPYLGQEDIDFIENSRCTFKMIRYDWLLDEGK